MRLGQCPRPPRTLPLCAAANEAHADRIAFHKFCQWRFFEQWLALKAYANERGIADRRRRADLHRPPERRRLGPPADLFELDANGHANVVAGVPPDYFSATGQRWGNPLYRWRPHADEGYAWWIERVRRAFELVDIVRIDHFRGFAALLGDPGHRAHRGQGPLARRARARALFEAIAKALGPLPIIAEDLGLITPDVTALRKRFGFPGHAHPALRLRRRCRNVYLPHNHEPDSVVYTGTHDNDTTLGWWAGASDHERIHAMAYLACDGREMHWASDPRRLRIGRRYRDRPLAGRAGPARRAPHEPARPGRGLLEWRFEWSQVHPELASRAAALCRLYGR